ncbi:MAG: two component system response regulator [Proteobacteria bacterium]|nr:two component system response regulator [Pseudomonadota bacterium]
MTDLYQDLLDSINVPARFFTSGDAFLRAWSADWQGGLILDLRMPGIGGIEVLRRLREMDSHLPVIVVTGFGEIRSTVQAMKLGAIEFLEKPFTHTELIDAVQAMLEKSREHHTEQALCQEKEACLASLTTRELEVAKLIARGMTSPEIAALLSISWRTVDLHRAHIREKMKCSSSVELAALFSRDLR